MKEQCVYFGGPYKNYCGRAEYDSDARIFHGEVAGTQDVVTFQGKTLDEVGKAFRESVDDYLAFCEKIGQQPEKPFSGKFVARIDPAIHKQISAMAQAAGKSLNQFLCDALEAMVKAGGPPAFPP
jgi:predicted HicB family RNase H-like nuclease